MASQIFVNLPIKNLDQSVAFFAQLGFKFDPKFTDEKATCMIVNEGNSYVMLLVESFFKTFTSKPVCDAHKSTEVLICLSVESRQKVDEMVKKALAAGGTTASKPQDHGNMYLHGFQDLDGHLWEIMFMDSASST